MMTPKAQRSTLSSYPPPRNTSGAMQKCEPMTVSISLLCPRRKVFLEMPKSINFIFLLSLSQRIFQGLRSLWQIFLLLRQVRAVTISRTIVVSSSSLPMAVSARLGKGKCSMTRQATLLALSRYRALQWHMDGCFSSLIIKKDRFISSMCSCSTTNFFTAQVLLFPLCLHRKTQPFPPSPSFYRSSYLSRKELSLMRVSSSEPLPLRESTSRLESVW